MPMISHEMVCVFHIIPIFFPYDPKNMLEKTGKMKEKDGEMMERTGKMDKTPKKALGNQGEIMGIIWKNYEK